VREKGFEFKEIFFFWPLELPSSEGWGRHFAKQNERFFSQKRFTLAATNAQDFLKELLAVIAISAPNLIS
jgi:hypothetical protein